MLIRRTSCTPVSVTSSRLLRNFSQTKNPEKIPGKNVFRVESVSKNTIEAENLSRIITDWQKKECETRVAHEEAAKLRNFREISRLVLSCLLGKAESYEFFIAKDLKGVIWAVGVTRNMKKALSFEFLLSHPNSLLTKTSPGKGAPSAIVLHIFRKCIRENRKEIYLEALPESAPFCEKHGCTVIPPNNKPYGEMQISLAKIKQILNYSEDENPPFPFKWDPNEN